MIADKINDFEHDAIRFPGGNSAKNLKGIQNESTYVSNATLEKVKKNLSFVDSQSTKLDRYYPTKPKGMLKRATLHNH